MANYKDFRKQTNRRRRKRMVRRFFVLLCALALILTLSFAITKVLQNLQQKPDASVSQQGSTSVDETGVSNSILAPIPMQTGPDKSLWNTIGPVPQTLDYTVLSPDYRLIGLPENGIVDYSYFDRAVLVGDSVSQGWNIYESSMKEHAFVCAYKSIGPSALVNKQTLNPGTRPDEVAYDVIVGSLPKRVYILLGANALVRDGEAAEQSFLAYYGQLVDMLQQDLGSEVKFYIEAITPVRPDVNRKQPGLYKERIQRVNTQLAKLAQEKGCYFVNIYEALEDENGDLREEYAGSDGIHLTPAAYEVMAHYLATHTAYAADNPYLAGSPYYVEPVA